MRYYNLLTLALSFSLSTVAFLAAQHDDVPVQHYEFDDYVIEGYVQRIQFDNYEIRIVRDETPYLKYLNDETSEVIVMDEEIIIAQADEADDGDGANIDMMNANWCLIHPDDEICQDVDEEDEEEGC